MKEVAKTCLTAAHGVDPTPGGGGATVVVAVAGLWRSPGGSCEILAIRRPPGVHLGGFWELPGGKVRAGESVADALRRELIEEVGFAPDVLEPLVVVEHRYPDRTVRLHAMIGRAEGRSVCSATAHRWVPLEALGSCEWPPANGPINDALRRRLEPCAPHTRASTAARR